MIEQGQAQGGTLRRVGSRAQLVNQDERALIGLADDLVETADVGGKGAQAFLDVLFIADVGKNRGKDRQAAAFPCRYVHARLRHERKDAQGFQGDRFAAGVGAGYDQG
ncbi:MAG: hypothetical protein BWY77_01722 [bacterium ADurb.Bin431]|nr:MAG: hypothetical protein BWY77_01722 [bacterium ADurb.Bin431]